MCGGLIKFQGLFTPWPCYSDSGNILKTRPQKRQTQKIKNSNPKKTNNGRGSVSNTTEAVARAITCLPRTTAP